MHLLPPKPPPPPLLKPSQSSAILPRASPPHVSPTTRTQSRYLTYHSSPGHVAHTTHSPALQPSPRHHAWMPPHVGTKTCVCIPTWRVTCHRLGLEGARSSRCPWRTLRWCGRMKTCRCLRWIGCSCGSTRTGLGNARTPTPVGGEGWGEM